MNDKINALPSSDEFEHLKEELSGSFVTDNDKNLINRMIEADQLHLFTGWGKPGTSISEKESFLQDLHLADSSYPGGLEAYISNAQKLLADAKNSANPFDGYTPCQPDTVDLTAVDETYIEYERLAAHNLNKIAIVLVAGGLGERLGYPGIKLNIPVEVTTGRTYLEHYSSVILSMESRIGNNSQVPFIIMTSRDTNDKTLQALEENNYFGLAKDQVIMLKQELVPAIRDNEGHIAMNGPYSMALKPHGHGDIHMLMHSSGTAEKLLNKGIEHLLFIQDTNGQVFNAAFAAIGASIKHSFDFNSIAVNRIPGEAVGALTKLVKEGKDITVNVEYNQLDPLLRSTISPEGDIPNDKGFSVFPGNINVLVAKMSTYCKVLAESEGIIAEFVNPKYSDDTRSAFKKPTRLETMMQDLPKLFRDGERTGVTIFEREWCFSANKNNVSDAKSKYESDGPPESAATAESDFYQAGRTKLELAGCTPNDTHKALILGIPFEKGPRVILTPSFALTVEEIQSKLKNIELRDEATLVLDGEGISINGLKMSGSSGLSIKAINGAEVTVSNADISNKGYEMCILDEDNPDVPEYIKIRGYMIEDRGAAVYEFNEPGQYELKIP